MKGNPAVPGGLLTSKPTWSNASGCSATSAFFFPAEQDGRNHQGCRCAESFGTANLASKVDVRRHLLWKRTASHESILSISVQAQLRQGPRPAHASPPIFPAKPRGAGTRDRDVAETVIAA